MCLAIPACITQILDTGNAIVELDGVRKEISLALVDDAKVGDYVIVHVGYALSRLDQQEAELTLAMFEQLGLRDAASTGGGEA